MASNLLITDDVKSAFADLLGRKSRNVSDIRIEGKHISPKPNPIYSARERDIQIFEEKNNENASLALQSSAYSTPIKNHSIPHKSSLSAANTPSRGTVLASYIQRFRNTPALNPHERNKQEDFWWIKNGKKKMQKQKRDRPNTAPITAYSENINILNKPHPNQLMVINDDDDDYHSNQVSVSSSISDHVQLLNAKSKQKRKQIEYKMIGSSNHSSINSSPTKSIIDVSDAKSEDSDDDVSDQDFNILHPHYNNDHGVDDNLLHSLLPSNDHMHQSNLQHNDEPIDVDDILSKWRKKRRLKELASDNGMNAEFPSNKQESISNFFDDNKKDDELERIKQRLVI